MAGQGKMERRKADQPFDSQSRQSQLEAAFEATADPMVIYDADGIAVRANPTAIEAYGFDPAGNSRHVVTSRLSIRYPDGRPVEPDQLPSARALRGEKVVGMRILFTDGKGRDVIIRASASPLVTGGNIAGAVAIWQDITERERLIEQLAVGTRLTQEALEREQALREELEAQNEEITSQQEELRALNEELEERVSERTRELSQTNKQLRESEERYRRLVELSPDAIAVHSEGKVVYANPAAATLMGISDLSALIGRSVMSFVHPDSRAEVSRRIQQMLVEGKDVPILEEKFVRPDGSIIDVEVAAMPLIHQAQPSILVVMHDVTERKQGEKRLKDAFQRLERTLEGTINAMAMTVEMRDPYTAGHELRVARLACAMAEEMGLSEERIRAVKLASMVHDIGKIGVPAEILSKPSHLSDIEFGMIKTHPQIGYGILKTVEFPWPIAEIVHQHHERMNGKGYPLGLLGEDILLEAKILGVADVVEAMASHRPYRPALGIDVALREIAANKGIIYDADAVEACLRLFADKGFELESL